MSGIDFEYWDSCVFLAFLQAETHRPGELNYLQEYAQKFDAKLVGITTSTITVAEVYEARLTEKQRAFFRSMYSRSNFHFQDANYQICEVASEIRGFYKTNPVANENGVLLYPTTPDAIHVASAIAVQKGLNKSINLITLDSENKAKKNELGLTKLSGLVAQKWQQNIIRPPLKPKQSELLYGQSEPR